jgi:ferritin-like metal-binding protein YciE
MKLDTLTEALEGQLKDLYDVEQQLVKVFPELVQAVVHSDLKTAFEEHLVETRDQLDRLEKVFDILGCKPVRESCEAMQGLLKEMDKLVACPGNRDVKDAVLIGAAQRIEHYEMAAYGTAIAFAEQLGLDDVVDLLQESLDEEIEADEKLTSLAEGGIFTAGVNRDAGRASRPGA